MRTPSAANARQTTPIATPRANPSLSLAAVGHGLMRRSISSPSRVTPNFSAPGWSVPPISTTRSLPSARTSRVSTRTRADPTLWGGLPRQAFSSAGLAAIWAKEDTREAIFDALRQRGTYATTGPGFRCAPSAAGRSSRDCWIVRTTLDVRASSGPRRRLMGFGSHSVGQLKTGPFVPGR